MKISIESIRLTNFKGISAFTTEFDHSTMILGENGTGKTTVFDGWLWLLFDRDSRGFKAADACKTTDGAGFVHNLDHEVEAVILVDGREVKLRKQLREKWTKPRGREEAIYDGNVASFWIDDVPHMAGLYKDWIATNLLDEQMFNVLCDPMYFSTSLTWRKRLDILMDLCGGITNEEVIAGDECLEMLMLAMQGKSLEDFKAMTLEQRRRLDKEVNEIPVRIMEATRAIDKTTDYAAIERDLAAANARMSELERSQLDAIEAMKPIQELARQQIMLNNKREQVIADLVAKANAGLTDLRKTEMAVSGKCLAISSAWKQVSNEMLNAERRIRELETNNDHLRAEGLRVEQELTVIRKAEFEAPADDSFICPTCHQTLKADDINAKTEVMHQNWLREHDMMLGQLNRRRDSIMAEGQANAAEIKRLKAEVETKLQQAAAYQAKKDEADKELSSIRAQIEAFEPVTPTDFANNSDLVAIEEEIARIAEELNKPMEARNTSADDERKALAAVINGYRDQLVRRGLSISAEARIVDLRQELKDKACEKTKLDAYLYQIDRFIRARTEKIEAKINNLFADVSFKLFSEQINGGITETCEPIVNGTVFAKANTGGQINAGLDIIAAIGRHVGIAVPVWVDHAESVTSMNHIDTQMIRLVASYGQPLTVTKF